MRHARLLAAGLVCLAAQAQWVSHTSPAGFSLEHPSGWKVEAAGAQAILVRSPDRASFALIEPVFAPGTARQILQGLSFSSRSQLPGVRSNVITPVQGGDRAVASVAFAGGRASLLCERAGGGAMVFGIAAPAAAFDRQKQDLVRIVRSFRFARGSSGGAAPAALQYVSFRDPQEGAFTAQVPQGWQIKGGAVRHSATDIRGYVHAISPDGLYAAVNDPNIPPFIAPNPTMDFSGFSEGSWYPLMDGTRLLVQRPQTGLAYAQRYAATSLAPDCAAVQVKEQRERPDIAASFARAWAPLNNPMFQTRTTFGEYSFTCSRDGEPMAGYVLAGTDLLSSQGGTMWYVRALCAFFAPEQKAGTASAALNRMTESFSIDPQWYARQLNTTAEVSRIVNDANSYISKAQSDSYWNRQRSLDRAHQNYSDMQRGIQRVKDPGTGQEYEAVAGANYYWRASGSAKPFGTNTAEPPRGIDVTPLLLAP